MTKLTVVIDDEMNLKLNSCPNKAEFIRQAINEKLKHDNAQNNNKEETNALIKLLRNQEKNNEISLQLLAETKDLVEDLKERVMKSDSTILQIFSVIKRSNLDLYEQLIKMNIYTSQTVGHEWIQQNKSAIDSSILAKVQEFNERNYE